MGVRGRGGMVVARRRVAESNDAKGRWVYRFRKGEADLRQAPPGSTRLQPRVPSNIARGPLGRLQASSFRLPTRHTMQRASFDEGPCPKSMLSEVKRGLGTTDSERRDASRPRKSSTTWPRDALVAGAPRTRGILRSRRRTPTSTPLHSDTSHVYGPARRLYLIPQRPT